MREKPRDKERLEHILEACNSIIKGVRDYSFEEIEEIEGMRHVLVHDYFAIDINRLKAVVEKDIPSLQPQIQALYNAEIENPNNSVKQVHTPMKKGLKL